MLFSSVSLIAFLLGSGQVLAGSYQIADTFVGHSFLSGFGHDTFGDPTHGRVQYVDQETAQRLNLTYTTDDTLVIRADFQNVLDPSGPGRNSVRISSRKQWTTSVTVLDVRHMPVGCGTWPAFWTCGDNWPNGGEIDILEGVNDQEPNLTSLHTSEGCTQPNDRKQMGTTVSSNCDAHSNSNQGCGVRSNKPTSYGHGLNNVGGGWVVMERTPEFISVWHWARNEDVPAGVKAGGNSIDTSSFGLPAAHFVNHHCDIASKFGPNAIIINLTLCGDWAGSVFSRSGCPGNCVDYVNNNPEGFKDAYWEIGSLRVYA